MGTKVADNGKTYLQINVDVTMNLPNYPINAGQGDLAMNLNMNLAMKGTETVLFDEQAGELYQSTCKMTGTSTMCSPGQTDPTMKMAMTTTIQVTKVDK